MQYRTPINEIEEGIALAFGRKYRMMPQRTDKAMPNFLFHASEDGLHPGKLRGSAYVVRMNGNMADMSLDEVGRLSWGDPKGIVLIGFSDVIAFKAQDRGKFTIIGSKRGLYE